MFVKVDWFVGKSWPNSFFFLFVFCIQFGILGVLTWLRLVVVVVYVVSKRKIVAATAASVVVV